MQYSTAWSLVRLELCRIKPAKSSQEKREQIQTGTLFGPGLHQLNAA